MPSLLVRLPPQDFDFFPKTKFIPMKQTIRSKRTLGSLLLAGSLAFSFVTASAQGGGAGETYSVSTAQQKHGVLLEEFTGIHCGYCPGPYTHLKLPTN